MSAIARSAQADKWECIRRLRYGAIIRLFRHRYKTEVPDDDAGRPDLWQLMCNVSLSPHGAEEKMRNVLAVWAPWMPQWEVEGYIERIERAPMYERIPTAKALGEALLLKNADRELLCLWPIKPFDMTD